MFFVRLTLKERRRELKRLIRFQVNNNVDSEVYQEEYKSLSDEMEEVRRKRLEQDKVSLKSFDEILETINGRETLGRI